MSDPRGPFRTVVTVDSPTVERPEAVHLVTFEECSHVGRLNAAQSAPRIGEQVRCFNCAKDGHPSGKTCAEQETDQVACPPVQRAVKVGDRVQTSDGTGTVLEIPAPDVMRVRLDASAASHPGYCYPLAQVQAQEDQCQCSACGAADRPVLTPRGMTEPLCRACAFSRLDHFDANAREDGDPSLSDMRRDLAQEYDTADDAAQTDPMEG